MGVLFVVFIFICIKESIALTTNEIMSAIPAVNLQASQDPLSTTVRYSAREYIIPAHPNVLYSISPKVTSSRNPPQPIINTDTPSPSKVADSHTNLPSIASPKNLPAPTIPTRQNSESMRKVPEIIKETNSMNKHKSTRYLKLPGDNILYPIYTMDDINNLKDIAHTKYLQPPPIYNYNTSGINTYETPYTTNDNQIEKNNANSNPNMMVTYKGALPINENMRDDFHNLQDTRYTDYQKELKEKVDTEPRLVQRVPNILPENVNLLRENNGDKIYSTDRHAIEDNTEIKSLKAKMAPMPQTKNKQFLHETPYPTNSFMIPKNKDIQGFENLKEVKGNYQQVVRDINTSNGVQSTYSPVPIDRVSLDSPYKPKNTQAQLNSPYINTPINPIDNTHPFNTRHIGYLEPTQITESYNIQNNIDRSLINPINNDLKTQLKFTPEGNTQKPKDHVKDSPQCMSRFPEPQLRAHQLQTTFNRVMPNIENLPNTEPYTQVMETSRCYDTSISTGTIDSENQNIPLPKHKPNMELNVGNGDLKKQIDKIKQQYIILAYSPQTRLENQQNHERVMDEINNHQPRKMINPSKLESNTMKDVRNENTALTNEYYIKENPLGMENIQKITNNYLPNLNNQPNCTLSTPKIDLEYNKEWLQKSPEATNFRDFNKNMPISMIQHPMVADNIVSVQDSQALYDLEKYTHQNECVKRIEPTVSNQLPRKPQSYDTYIKNIYKEEPLTNVQESIPKNDVLLPSTKLNFKDNQIFDSNNNYNNDITKINTNPEHVLSCNMNNSNNKIRSVPLKFDNGAAGYVSKNTEKVNLNNDSLRPHVSSPSLGIQPGYQYPTISNDIKCDKFKDLVNIANTPIIENTQRITKQNAPQESYPHTDPNTVNIIQNTDSQYAVIGESFKTIETKAPPINILPIPIEPAVIQRPGVYTVSAKPIITEPQVYTRVPSSYADSQVVYNPDSKLTFDPEVKTIQGNLCPSIMPSKTEELQYTNTLPVITPTTHNVPLSITNVIESNAITPSVSRSYSNPIIQYTTPSNDRYTSLISSSLNNIASVLVTNLLSSLKNNMINSMNSFGTSSNSSKSSQISNTNLPYVSPEFPQPSLDVPIFSVIPPCIESPRLLPDPCVTNLEKNSSSKTKSVSKIKTSKSKDKSLDKKPFVSSITINVLPSVQQTSNDIIILV